MSDELNVNESLSELRKSNIHTFELIQELLKFLTDNKKDHKKELTLLLDDTHNNNSLEMRIYNLYNKIISSDLLDVDDSTKLELEKELNNLELSDKTTLKDLVDKINEKTYIKLEEDELNNIYKEIQKFRMTKLGKIEVYLRIRKGKIMEEEKTSVNNKMITFGCDEETNKKYGPFKEVFRLGEKNKNIYNAFEVENLKNIYDKTTIIFSYGVSGSGKSHTILGNKTEDGLLTLAIDKLIEDGNTCKIKYIFEQCLDTKFSDSFIQHEIVKSPKGVLFNKENLKGHINIFIDSDDKLKNIFKDQYTDKKLKNVDTRKNIKDILIEINSEREKNGTIKPTPNNSQSSRSHLFFVYEIKNNKNGNVGYIVFVDSAGRENPMEILKLYYNIYDLSTPFIQYDYSSDTISTASLGRITNKTDYPESLQLSSEQNKFLEMKNSEQRTKKDLYNSTLDKLKDQRSYIKKLVVEGFFIDETLNHMIKYLSPKLGQVKIKDKSLVVEYEQTINKNEQMCVFFNDEEDKDQILTKKIFNFLTTKDDERQPYNFIMMATTLDPEDYIYKNRKVVDEKEELKRKTMCLLIESTLKFCNDIKST